MVFVGLILLGTHGQEGNTSNLGVTLELVPAEENLSTMMSLISVKAAHERTLLSLSLSLSFFRFYFDITSDIEKNVRILTKIPQSSQL